MHRLIRLFTLVLMGLCAVPVLAQDTTYAEAQRRIEEAKNSGATELDLSIPGLAQIPPEIGQLTGLQKLTISGTQITSLPPEIGQLENLTHLVATHNLITRLPLELGRLKNLDTQDGLQMWDNPIEFPPSQITEQNLPVILHYLRNIEARQRKPEPESFPGLAITAAGVITLALVGFCWPASSPKKKRNAA